MRREFGRFSREDEPLRLRFPDPETFEAADRFARIVRRLDIGFQEHLKNLDKLLNESAQAVRLKFSTNRRQKVLTDFFRGDLKKLDKVIADYEKRFPAAYGEMLKSNTTLFIGTMDGQWKQITGMTKTHFRNILRVYEGRTASELRELTKEGISAEKHLRPPLVGRAMSIFQMSRERVPIIREQLNEVFARGFAGIGKGIFTDSVPSAFRNMLAGIGGVFGDKLFRQITKRLGTGTSGSILGGFASGLTQGIFLALADTAMRMISRLFRKKRRDESLSEKPVDVRVINFADFKSQFVLPSSLFLSGRGGSVINVNLNVGGLGPRPAGSALAKEVASLLNREINRGIY